jgi:hypothetical protein
MENSLSILLNNCHYPVNVVLFVFSLFIIIWIADLIYQLNKGKSTLPTPAPPLLPLPCPNTQNWENKKQKTGWFSAECNPKMFPLADRPASTRGGISFSDVVYRADQGPKSWSIQQTDGYLWHIWWANKSHPNSSAHNRKWKTKSK